MHRNASFRPLNKLEIALQNPTILPQATQALKKSLLCHNFMGFLSFFSCMSFIFVYGSDNSIPGIFYKATPNLCKVGMYVPSKFDIILSEVDSEQHLSQQKSHPGQSRSIVSNRSRKQRYKVENHAGSPNDSLIPFLEIH